MKNTETLTNAVKTGDKALIRAHGWNLWAGIMQPAKGLDWPVWYTWQNTFGAFAAGKAVPEIELNAHAHSLIQRNIAHVKGTIMDTLSNVVPYYPIPQPVIDEFYKDSVFNPDTSGIIVGKTFMFNGDIMIPTESLSEAAFEWIRGKNLYQQSELNALYDNPTVHRIDAPQKHIVTKHMYWPVLAEGISALPVWKDNYYPDNFPGYAGYETWTELVGIDPSGEYVGKTAEVSYLYDVFKNRIEKDVPLKTVTAMAQVHGLDDFYYHKVTKTDWENFDAADKAILNAASYWAHNKPFGIGDYIVTVAMHVNTKEIPTWALQSVWWSNTPDEGQYAQNRPDLPQAEGPWDHYLLVDAYGVVDPETQELPIAMNPYIELAIHPNCYKLQ